MNTKAMPAIANSSAPGFQLNLANFSAGKSSSKTTKAISTAFFARLCGPSMGMSSPKHPQFSAAVPERISDARYTLKKDSKARDVQRAFFGQRPNTRAEPSKSSRQISKREAMGTTPQDRPVWFKRTSSNASMGKSFRMPEAKKTRPSNNRSGVGNVKAHLVQ